ncbi:hypothetical protein D3C84_1081190 [compost metagenome]
MREQHRHEAQLNADHREQNEKRRPDYDIRADDQHVIQSKQRIAMAMPPYLLNR